MGLIVCAKEKGVLTGNGRDALNVRVKVGSLRIEGLETIVMHAKPRVVYQAMTYSLANHVTGVDVRNAAGRVQKNVIVDLHAKGTREVKVMGLDVYTNHGSNW